MRGYERVFSNDDEVHAQSGKYGCIGAFDVIEHIDNDSQFLAQISLLLEPGGVLVATVPAHQFLYGPYDEAARHFRRYEKSELHHKLRAAGFEVIQISYWNMSLFPVAALLRLFGTKTGGSLSPSAITDKILGWIVATEAFALRFVPLPIGLSIVFVAQRQ